MSFEVGQKVRVARSPYRDVETGSVGEVVYVFDDEVLPYDVRLEDGRLICFQEDELAALSNEVKTYEQKVDKLKMIENAAYKWEAGELSAERLAEIVFGLVNEETEKPLPAGTK